MRRGDVERRVADDVDLGVRKLATDDRLAPRHGGGAGPFQATMALSLVLLAAYLFVAWAMAGKPM